MENHDASSKTGELLLVRISTLLGGTMGETNRRKFLKESIGVGVPTCTAKDNDRITGQISNIQQLFKIRTDALYVWEFEEVEKVAEMVELLGANRIFFSFPGNQQAISQLQNQTSGLEIHALLSVNDISGAATDHQTLINEIRRMNGITGVHFNHEAGGNEKDRWLREYLDYLNSIETGGLETSITLDWKWYDTSVEGTSENTIERGRRVREHETVDWVVVMPYHVNPTVAIERIYMSMDMKERDSFSRKPFLFAVETQNPKTNPIHENSTIYGKDYFWTRDYLTEIRQSISGELRTQLIGDHVAVHDFKALLNQIQTFSDLDL